MREYDKGGAASAAHEEKNMTIQFLNPEAEIAKRRHALPHWEQGETCQFVTFRLADSLPEAKLRVWRVERDAWLAAHPRPWDDETAAEYGREFGARLDAWLDAGHGSCVLGEEENRRVVLRELLRDDGGRYRLHAAVVMPNHVHALVTPCGGGSIAVIVRGWKGASAKAINVRMGRAGRLWQKEYWDRLVRSERHFARIVRYIVENPGRLPIPVHVSEEVKAMIKGGAASAAQRD